MRKLKNSELKRISPAEFKNTRKTPIILVLDNVRSAMNVGSVFRTSDAFIIEKIYLCGITATPPNKEILKAALGAQQAVDWQHMQDVTTLIKSLKQSGNYIVSVEQVENATALNEFKLPKKKIVLVFGNEVFGVNQQIINLSDESIEIPQFGTKHSLNISVSAGIVMWELWKKMKR